MLRLRIGLADTAILSRELGKEVTRYFRLYQWTFCPWWVYWTNIYNSSSLRCKENYKHLTESLPTPLTPYVHKFDHSLLCPFQLPVWLTCSQVVRSQFFSVPPLSTSKRKHSTWLGCLPPPGMWSRHFLWHPGLSIQWSTQGLLTDCPTQGFPVGWPGADYSSATKVGKSCTVPAAWPC